MVDRLELPVEIVHIVDALQVLRDDRTDQFPGLRVLIEGLLHPIIVLARARGEDLCELARRAVLVAVDEALIGIVALVLHRHHLAGGRVVAVVGSLGALQPRQLLHRPRHPALDIIAVPRAVGARTGRLREGAGRYGIARPGHVARHKFLSVLRHQLGAAREGQHLGKVRIRKVVPRTVHLPAILVVKAVRRIDVHVPEAQWPLVDTALHGPAEVVIVRIGKFPGDLLLHVLREADLAVLAVAEARRALVGGRRLQQLTEGVVRESAHHCPRKRLGRGHKAPRPVIVVAAEIVIGYPVGDRYWDRRGHGALQSLGVYKGRAHRYPEETAHIWVHAMLIGRAADRTDVGLRNQVVYLQGAAYGGVRVVNGKGTDILGDMDVHIAKGADPDLRVTYIMVLEPAARGRKDVAVTVAEDHHVLPMHVARHPLGGHGALVGAGPGKEKAFVEPRANGHREGVALLPLPVYLVAAQHLLRAPGAQPAVDRPDEGIGGDVLVGVRVGRAVERAELRARPDGGGAVDAAAKVELLVAVARPRARKDEIRGVDQARAHGGAERLQRRAAVAVVERLARPHLPGENVPAQALRALAEVVEVAPALPNGTAREVEAHATDLVPRARKGGSALQGGDALRIGKRKQ